MAPRRGAKVTCVCVACSEHQHVDASGAVKPGLEVDAKTFQIHMRAERQRASFIQAADEEFTPDYGEFPFGRPDDDPPPKDPPIEQSELLSSLAGLSFENDSPQCPSNVICYDCTSFHHLTAGNLNPVVTLVNLKTALFYVTQMCSTYVSSCLLKIDRMILELMATHGLGRKISNKSSLTYADQMALQALPKDTRTVINRLAIDPQLTFFICCPDCFAMYPDASSTPQRCAYTRFPNADSENQLIELNDDSDDNVRKGNDLTVCGAQLFKKHGTKSTPVRRFAVQNLYDWLGRLFSRMEIENALHQTAIKSQSPYDSSVDISDIQDSRIWREFLGADGQPFTSSDGNVVFGMFMDAINPFGNRQSGKHASVTFIIMICLSLPVSLRYRPENIFLVGIAPGPKEPSLEQVNWIIRPVVEQLKILWSPGIYLSKTARHPAGRMISAALLPFFADLPALRRSLGFAAPSATRMCSYCLLKRSDITNLKPETWPARTLEDHRKWANKSREAANIKEQDKILRDHGVRYSVLLELSYWNILDYHVVDSMHNLLLGLLKWHCQRFWLMADVATEEPEQISNEELSNLFTEASSNPPARQNSPPVDDDDEQEDDGVAFRDMLFGNSTDFSDTDFIPCVTGNDWGGSWAAPTEGEIIFDHNVLSYVNSRLQKIHIPTWIKRAIPVLGKASFGRLKADEWRSLFTIQLPLILPPLWNNGDPISTSLLQNFFHLVSLVNLALKRSMNPNLIKQYRHHLSHYMESSTILFPDTKLAPNHHMAFHLADCLERFGPCRAWWSFSMERLMAQVLKTSGNNRLGQLEITYLKNFGRVANLRVLLQDGDFSSILKPCIKQIQSLYEPIPSAPATQTRHNIVSLQSATFEQLIIRLNERFPIVNGKWLASNKWEKLQGSEADKSFPVRAQVRELPQVRLGDVVYSTVKRNKNNCMVALKPEVKVSYGIIRQIFEHSRSHPGIPNSTTTWVEVQPLVPIASIHNPYKHNTNHSMGLSLRKIDTLQTLVVALDEILAHCAWMRYKPGELRKKIADETFALVCIDR